MLRHGSIRRRLALRLALACTALLCPHGVEAYEDAWVLEAGLSAARLPSGWLDASGDQWTPALSLGVSRGLDDAWSVRVRASGAPLRIEERWRPSASGGVDLLYAFDLLEVVPYASLGAGAGWVPRRGDGAVWMPTVRLGLGVDWLLGWRHLLGLELLVESARGSGGAWSERWQWLARWGIRLED